MPSPAVDTDVKTVAAKPFLKWAGSKRQLLARFLDAYPPALLAGQVKKYYEPFLGGGAVFFDIAQRYEIKAAYLSDVNEDLVLTYQVVQSKVADLIELLLQHEKKYLSLGAADRLAYFYEQRRLFNLTSTPAGISGNARKTIVRAAALIFLNRTCYNGLYRVNSKGAFNSPAGAYAQPTICDERNLLQASRLLSGAIIENKSYSAITSRAAAGSFVYFDPPYRPLSHTASFTAYSKAAFTDKDQQALSKVCRKLDKKQVLFMLSNSDTGDGFFEQLFQGFSISRIPARRSINADPSKRGFINELLITNYPGR